MIRVEHIFCKVLRIRVDDREGTLHIFHEVPGDIRNGPHIFRDLAHISKKYDQAFYLRTFLDPVDLLDSFMTRGIASDSPDGIRGVKDGSFLPEDFDAFLYF